MFINYGMGMAMLISRSKLNLNKMKKLKLFSIAFSFFALAFGTSFAGSSIESESSLNSSRIGIISNSARDRVVVSFDNEGENPYMVLIEDADGKTLHSEMVCKKGLFNKRYDLGELADGEYTIKVSHGSEIKSSEILYKN
jgi:hypothetical protein